MAQSQNKRPGVINLACILLACLAETVLLFSVTFAEPLSVQFDVDAEQLTVSIRGEEDPDFVKQRFTLPRRDFDPKDSNMPARLALDGLRLNDREIGPSRIRVQSSVSPKLDRATLLLEVDAASIGELLVIDSMNAFIAADTFFLESIAFTGEHLTIAGEVLGSVWLLSGDLRLEGRGVVGGDVVVVNGTIRQAGAAKIYGSVFAPGGYKKKRLGASRLWQMEGDHFGWWPALSYDRVDGARPGLGARITVSKVGPYIKLWGGYALASETGQFKVRIHQRLSRVQDIGISVEAFRLTTTEDSLLVDRSENTALALIAGEDYRDYFGTDGVLGALSLNVTGRHTAQVAFVYEDYRAMRATRRLWSIAGSDQFDENFNTLDVDERPEYDSLFSQTNTSARFFYRLLPADKGDHPKGLNTSGWLELELASSKLGGDFDYERLQGGASLWWDALRKHRFMISGLFGLSHDELPPNKLVYVGGLSTLRGYRHKEFHGTDGFVGTFEYRFRYWSSSITDGAIIAFFDLGRVSTGQPLDVTERLFSDAGIALEFGEYFRVNLARGLDRSGRDWLLSVRLQRMLP